MSSSTDPTHEEEEELYEHHRFSVDPGQELLRIDRFLMDRVPNTSRTKLQTAARNGNIKVNDQVVKPNYKVRPGDDISIVLPYPQREIELIPERIPLDIIYEDAALVVVNKTAGMVVHPGYGNYTGTLVNALLGHFEELPTLDTGYDPRPGLVHRLDKNTSGVMVAVATSVLPAPSSAVKVTVIVPLSEQSALSGLTDRDTEPQLSFEPPSTSVEVMATEPAASKYMVMFWAMA